MLSLYFNLIAHRFETPVSVLTNHHCNQSWPCYAKESTKLNLTFWKWHITTLMKCWLCNTEEQFHESLGKVTGWGHTMEGGPASMVLRETDVAVMSNAACHEKPGYGPSKVNGNMMCAGVMQGGRDSCQVLHTTNPVSPYPCSGKHSSCAHPVF